MVQKALQHLSWCCICIVVFIVAITMCVHDSSSLSSTNAVTPLVVDFMRYRRPSNDTLLYRVQVDLSLDLFAQAHSACDFLNSDCDPSQRRRCLHDALVTLRHEKVKLMLSGAHDR